MEYRFLCFQCSAEIVLSHLPGRNEDCPKCSADLHVCRNCQHYDRSAYNECREPMSDIVKEKDRANFCDYFQPGSSNVNPSTAKNDLLAAAEALFKKKT